MADGRRGRREYLAALGLVATVGLTGCTDDSEDDVPAIDGNGDSATPSDDRVDRRPDWPEYMDDASDQGYEDLRGEAEVTITVDNNNFDPTFVWIDPGTTITWEFDASGHTVEFHTQPAGADLSGTPGGDFDVVDEGETHSVTPEIGGMYIYHCVPHEGMGMKGAIAVGAVE